MDYTQTMRNEAQRCIRCGFCVYCCPSWLAHGKLEYYSPRGRVVLMNGMLANGGEVRLEDIVDSIYSCNTCRRCLLDCPAGIDVAELVILARWYILNKLKSNT